MRGWYVGFVVLLIIVASADGAKKRKTKKLAEKALSHSDGGPDVHESMPETNELFPQEGSSMESSHEPSSASSKEANTGSDINAKPTDKDTANETTVGKEKISGETADIKGTKPEKANTENTKDKKNKDKKTNDESNNKESENVERTNVARTDVERTTIVRTNDEQGQIEKTKTIREDSSNATTGDQMKTPDNIEQEQEKQTRGNTTDTGNIDPLDIFVGNTNMQNFPVPMRLSAFKAQVLGNAYKKMYILEQSDVRLFGQVRQLQANYSMEGDELHVSFLFRFIFTRKCAEVKDFYLGKLVGSKFATFEKTLKDGKTERLFFFSDRPEDYLFLMSCKDMKSSPRTCHDNYYVSMGTTHDPPNQFPWQGAGEELGRQLGLSFEDPRFIFNFVMTPCISPSS